MKAPSGIRHTSMYLTCQSYMKGSDETWFVYTCQHVWSKPIINNWAIIINKTGRACPNVFFSALQDARFSAEAEIWEESGNVLLGSPGIVLDPVESLSSGAGQKKNSQAEALIVKASVLAS